MLSEIFYWLLNMSIIGSMTGGMILILRKVKVLPIQFVYALWVVPFARLWIPTGIANKYSLLNLLSTITTRTVVIRTDMPKLTMTNSLMVADQYFPLEYKSAQLENIFNIASVIWVAIAAVAVLTVFILYILTKSEFKDAKCVKGNLYKSEKAKSPVVLGILRPKIIIPNTDISDDLLPYITMHEQVHINRRDNLLRLIAIMTACVHCFNPLMWLFAKCFFEDMEMTCDIKAIKGLRKNVVKDYARAIVTCGSGKTFLISAFGNARVRIRIENILTYRKLTFVSSCCFSILAVSIVTVLMTNAVG